MKYGTFNNIFRHVVKNREGNTLKATLSDCGSRTRLPIQVSSERGNFALKEVQKPRRKFKSGVNSRKQRRFVLTKKLIADTEQLLAGWTLRDLSTEKRCFGSMNELRHKSLGLIE
jgi:hypothetical protein